MYICIYINIFMYNIHKNSRLLCIYIYIYIYRYIHIYIYTHACTYIYGTIASYCFASWYFFAAYRLHVTYSIAALAGSRGAAAMADSDRPSTNLEMHFHLLCRLHLQLPSRLPLPFQMGAVSQESHLASMGHIHVHMCIYVCANNYAYQCICICIHLYIYIYISMYVYLCKYSYMHTCEHVR